MLTMIQDKFGCRLVYLNGGVETLVVGIYSGRVEMKREARKFAKAKAEKLFNMKKSGITVEV